MADTNWGGGSGAADALNEILTQRRMEARQAFLDQLNAQNVQSEINYRNENAADLKDQREAKAAQMKQATMDALGKTLHKGQRLDPSTVAKLDPSWVNKPSGPPAAADNAGVPPSLAQVGDYDYTTFAGSPQDQKDAEILKRQQDWLAGPQGQQIPQAVQAQMQFDALSGKPMTIPAGDWKAGATDTTKHSPEWIEYQDYAADVLKSGGKPLSFDAYATMDANRKKPAPVNMQFLPNFSNAPDAPPGYNRSPRTGAIEPVVIPPPPVKPLVGAGPKEAGPVVNGQAVTPESYNTSPVTQGNVPPPPKPVLTRPTAAQTKATKPSLVSPTLLNAVRIARTIATPKSAGGKVDPQAQANLDAAINNALLSIPNEDLKAQARQIVTNPKTANLTTDQIVAKVKEANPGMNDITEGTLTDILLIMRNK